MRTMMSENLPMNWKLKVKVKLKKQLRLAMKNLKLKKLKLKMKIQLKKWSNEQKAQAVKRALGEILWQEKKTNHRKERRCFLQLALLWELSR
jgi:hypothetical protein